MWFADRAAVLVVLVALGPVWSSADPRLPFGGETARQVSLLKGPHEDLRIRWSAMVHEEGGEFLISRQGFGGSTSVVARVRPRGDGRYEVVEQSAAGSWIYKLRYRDGHGRDHVLVTIHLNVEGLDAGRGIRTANADGQPAALGATVLPLPGAASLPLPLSQEAAVGGPGRWPPTPPP